MSGCLVYRAFVAVVAAIVPVLALACLCCSFQVFVFTFLLQTNLERAQPIPVSWASFSRLDQWEGANLQIFLSHLRFCF